MNVVSFVMKFGERYVRPTSNVTQIGGIHLPCKAIYVLSAHSLLGYTGNNPWEDHSGGFLSDGLQDQAFPGAPRAPKVLKTQSEQSLSGPGNSRRAARAGSAKT